MTDKDKLIDVREVFDNELREMESGFLRKVYRIFIGDYFKALIKITEERLFNLKRQGYLSRKREREEVIYQGIVTLEEFEYSKDSLFPYFPEDMVKGDELNLFNRGNEVLVKGLILGKKEKISEIENSIYFGSYWVEGEEKKFEYLFERDKSYLKEEEKIKEIYEQNNIKWTPIFGPYSRKMYKLKVKNISELQEDFGKIEKLSFNHDNVEFLKDYILVWNVKREKVLSTSDSSYKNNGYYEHRIEISSENRVMVDLPEVEIVDIFRDRLGDLIVAAKTKNVISWDICIVKKKIELIEFKEFKYKLVSNEQYEDFSGIMKKVNGRRVRSMGEIYRLSKAFKSFDNMEIKDINHKKRDICIKIQFEKEDIFKEEIKGFFKELLYEEFWESNFEIII